MTPGFTCVTQPALQHRSFLTRLHLSTWLSGVHNTAKKCPKTFHITPPCLEKDMWAWSHAWPYYLFVPAMLQGQDASSSKDENLDFETPSPLKHPVHAVWRPEFSCLHFALSQKSLSISPLSEISSLWSQGCTFHQAQRKPWPCLRMVNSGYPHRVNRAETFNTPRVLKNQLTAFIRNQEAQRQSCVLTRNCWALTLSLLFPDLANTPLLLPFFPHGNPYSPHLTRNRVMIPTRQLQKVKMCSAPHLLRLFISSPTSAPCSLPSSIIFLVQPRKSHQQQLSPEGDLKSGVGQEESGYSEKWLSFVFWNLVWKKKPTILSFNWK